MDRAEGTGLGIAAIAHIALLAVLSLGLFTAPRPVPPITDSMDVQLTDAVGLKSTAPVVATEPPAPSEAPEIGTPEDAAPPEPTPAPPVPEPTPPPPAPKVAKPEPTPAPVADKPAPKPAKPKPAAPPSPRLSSDLLKSLSAQAKSEGRSAAAAAKPKGARLGQNFLKGVVESGEGKGAAPRAAVGQAAMNGLGAAIKRQVQPCYERKPLVGPGADRIRTVLRLRFKPDGTLAGRPTMSEQTGIDDENGRYARRAAEVAIAAVMECVPLKLPAELYAGGWEDIEPTFSQRPGA